MAKTLLLVFLVSCVQQSSNGKAWTTRRAIGAAPYLSCRKRQGKKKACTTKKGASAPKAAAVSEFQVNNGTNWRTAQQQSLCLLPAVVAMAVTLTHTQSRAEQSRAEQSSGTPAPHHTTTTCVRQSDGVGCLSVAARRARRILNVAHAISKSHSRYFILLPSDFKNLSTIIAVLFHAQRRRRSRRRRRRTTTTTITTPPPTTNDDGGGRCVDA